MKELNDLIRSGNSVSLHWIKAHAGHPAILPEDWDNWELSQLLTFCDTPDINLALLYNSYNNPFNNTMNTSRTSENDSLNSSQSIES